jgi:gamma-glutamylcyclotransferase
MVLGEGTGPDMTVTYFAYASNMAPEVIARLCPQHRYLGVACLADHRLAFTRRSVKTGTGVADIIEAPGETVWGVLYKIADDELAAIDRKEGQGWAYTRVILPVRLEADGSECAAVTYTVRAKEPAEIAPSRQYLGQVIAAAHERGLPGPYVERLEAMSTARTRQGLVRPDARHVSEDSQQIRRSP